MNVEIYTNDTYLLKLDKVVNCENKLMEYLYYKDVLQDLTGKMVSIVDVVKSNVTIIYFKYLE